MAEATPIQAAVKDPDAAQAKKLLDELEELLANLAPPAAQARAGLHAVFGEARDMQVQRASYPAPAPLRTAVTPLGRSFFPDAFRIVADLRRAADDIKVIAAQVRELPGKV
jgi:hypothetical protein